MKSKVIRSKAVLCPYCGAVESMHADRTLKFVQKRQIVRYSHCVRCGKRVVRVLDYS